MNAKIYVSNLAAATTENDLIDLFSAYGNVSNVNIAVDRVKNMPLGFGFVTMATPEGARAAIQAINGEAIGTCNFTVSEVCPPEMRAGSLNGRCSPRRRASRLY